MSADNSDQPTANSTAKSSAKSPTTKLKPPFVLVDGSSYLFRAYHALPPLTNSAGHPTGAIKGVVGMLKKLLEEYQPEHIAVVFDAKGKTFRHEQYPDYKANRPPMAEELACQIAPLHEIIRAMGLPLIVETGVEADDVIGTLAKQAVAHQHQVLISTGDKDMIQLVSPDVHLVNTMKNERTDPEQVAEKYGFPAEHFIDYLAMMGDKVDNIPGLPNVGDKTARALLTELGNIEHIYQNLDAIAALKIRGAKSLKQKFIEFEEQLRLSYDLATIQCDLTLAETLDELVRKPEDADKLIEFFETFEFKAWKEALASGQGLVGQRLVGQGAPSKATAESTHARPEYDCVLEQADWDLWWARLQTATLVALDTETTSLNYRSAKVVGLCFAIKENNKIDACYVPLAHDYEEAPNQLDKQRILQQLKPWLENPDVIKVGQNLKYDMHVLANEGIKLQGTHHDTMLASYVWNATGSRHDMDTLANKYLDRSTIKFEEIAGKGVKQKTFNQIELDQAAPYAAEDAEITYGLHEALFEKLCTEPSLKKVYEELEVPLMPILNRIERTGTLIDTEALAAQTAELTQQITELQTEINELAGEAFNVDSPKQLGEILYQKLKLPVLKKTPKGAPSTAEPVLQELALDYPLPELVLAYRSCSKLRSTYTEKLPQLVHPETGRIHTSYHQAVTATGRLSSSDPNLQNIPIRTEQGRKIRQAFIAPEGCKLVACDYSQVELRIMAHLSQDEGLITAFKTGQDIHRATAAEVLEKNIDEVTQEERREAKAVNFGLIYGMSAFGLAKQLGIDRNQAQAYIDRYFARYPGVLDFMDNIKASAREKGYVETLRGRRLYQPVITASNKMRQQAAERTAINAPMQGTAADIIKKAMIDIQAWLDQEQLQTSMIMQVHDELVLEVPDKELNQIVETVPRLMEQAVALTVPLLVEPGVGNNWDEAH